MLCCPDTDTQATAHCTSENSGHLSVCQEESFNLSSIVQKKRVIVHVCRWKSADVGFPIFLVMWRRAFPIFGSEVIFMWSLPHFHATAISDQTWRLTSVFLRRICENEGCEGLQWFLLDYIVVYIEVYLFIHVWICSCDWIYRRSGP